MPQVLALYNRNYVCYNIRMDYKTGRMLLNLLDGYPSVSILGMCKNAGKTTVLNRLISESAGSDALAITSIGRDGETADVVTGTKKPSIYIREGMMFATATGLLPQCDVTKEILFTTGFYTPMGEVVVLRALSDGNVQLAGPSMTEQLMKLKKVFLSFGAGRIFTDGAVSRKTLCDPGICDAAILCAGASCNKDMSEVIKDAAFFTSIFTLDEVREDEIPGGAKLFLRRSGSWEAAADSDAVDEVIRKEHFDHTRRLYMNGALTDSFLKKLFTAGEKGRGVEITVHDASKILLSRAVYEKFTRIKGRITVFRPFRLAAVAINPFSAYGHHFNKEAFLRQMQSAVSIPVINVEDLPDVGYRF